MGRIIASTYEIGEKIGSGGGGVVYLGQHLRLHKKVVLKVDKRSLSANQQLLRREVDALKNLSHRYIPQVYDFIEEDGYTYTVIDYIEGESMDKPLKRGERFSQPQVIEWACELLEALSYLHQYPPHGILHADIKPSNIMLTPQGDIRLIDFNIALALGEEGAVAVGRSFGYASPEHYGIDFSTRRNVTESQEARPTREWRRSDEKTELMEKTQANGAAEATTALPDTAGEQETEPLSEPVQSSAKRTVYASGSVKLLDVRSDIYSLGATLYHILTGKRPAGAADEVEPISADLYSPALIAILEKAMHPDPAERFQTADEMLAAFRHLWQDDPRTRRYKRSVKTAAIALGAVLLCGVGLAFTGLHQREKQQDSLILAEYAENALRDGDVSGALRNAMDAVAKGESVLFGVGDTANAQEALTDALQVYDLSDGFKAAGRLALPSEPLFLRISPEGKTAVALCDGAFLLFDVATQEILYTLPAEPSALAEACYIGENRIVYAGEDGICAFDLEQGKPLWTGDAATAICVSADQSTVAAIYKEETHAVIYSAKDGARLRQIDFGGKRQSVGINDTYINPQNDLFALSADGSWLGISFADGSLYAYPADGEELQFFDETSGFTHFEGDFSGQYFAFSGTSATQSVFAVFDLENMEQTGGFASESPFGVQADESGIYVQTENILVKLHPVTGEQTPLVNTAEWIRRFARGDGYTVISTENGCSFYDKQAELVTKKEMLLNKSLLQLAGGYALLAATDAPEVQILSLENHAEAQLFAYDPSYAHSEARISADGETVMLFSYDSFRLYRRSGEILADVAIPDADTVYDQQYRRDEKGSYLEVIYYDGRHRAYSAADGGVMDEWIGDAPDASLYEEFFTDNLRVTSPLHGTPAAYDKNSGKLIRELESEDYLTYVTQVGDYILTEYITAKGERYGLLLNEHCETLAYLPQLCDVWNGELIFDYPSGDLRKTRIYHINELKDLAQKTLSYKEEGQ